MTAKIYLYPGWIRFWHICNALLCLTLIVTGVSMQYSGVEAQMIKFGKAVSLHNISGVILSFMYLIFFMGNMFNRNGKFYKIKLKGFFERLKKQAFYYTFGIFKGEHAPFPVTESNKFNPLQQFTYVAIMYIGVPLVIISGWLMLYPDLILPYLHGFNAILFTDILHVIMGFFISVFLIIHVYFCTIGKTPLSNFKSMITGWHEAHD